ncbi:MAG: endonuclease domain-containing protein [Anaerolineales bacterium]|nr:endonuclease domain-containing protein [Anaerolineales bacterium]
MGKENIVIGQKVSREKLKRARELRQEMTPAEHRLWSQLRANRMAGWHFRRQQIIDGFIVDFYCHKAGLVIEVDGPIHQKQKVEDAERAEVLSARGLRILRFTNREVMNNLRQVLQTILDTLKTDSPFLEERG